MVMNLADYSKMMLLQKDIVMNMTFYRSIFYRIGSYDVLQDITIYRQ